MKARLITFMAMLAYCHIASAELLDPRERDENISDTDVSVSVERLDSDFYRYSYRLESGEANNGTVRVFKVDLKCDQEFADYEFPDFNSGRTGMGVRNPDEPPRYSSAIVRFERDTRLFGISRDRYAFWASRLDPGETRAGMTIISPLEPGMREYVLVPAMPTGDYDYDSLPDDVTLDDLPQVWDFEVTGLIEAPTCPGVTPTPELPRFEGASSGVTQAPEAINTLLTYSEPLQDRFMVPADQDSLTLTIYYDGRLDPERFRVEPGHLQSLFSPVPGTSETVAMPLDGAINEFLLEAQGSNSGLRDKDLFEVRLRHAADDASAE